MPIPGKNLPLEYRDGLKLMYMGMANLLSAHRDPGNPVHRAEVAKLWGVEDLPSTPGKTAVEMFEAIRAGEIKIIWIACTHPAQSLPDQKLVRGALNKAEPVIAQEACKTTATVGYADVLLPATSWGEMEWIVTNSERRITHHASCVTGAVLAAQDLVNHGTPNAVPASLQGKLKCGTNCGSCLPELKKIIGLHGAPEKSAA